MSIGTDMQASTLFYSRSKIKILLSFFLVYGVFLQWSGWLEHANFDFAKALVEERRLTIDSYADNNVDRLLINGHYYSNKPIGAALMIAPGYALWKLIYNHVFPESFQKRDLASTVKVPIPKYSLAVHEQLSLFERLGRILATLLSSTLSVLLTVWLVYRFAGLFGAGEADSWLVAAAFGFGTIAFDAATALYHDTMGMLFSFLSFYLLFQAKEKSRFSLVLIAGIMCGWSISVGRWGVLAVPAFLAYLMMTGLARKIPLFLAGCLLGIVPQLLHNCALVGHPLFPPAYIFQDPQIWSFWKRTWEFELELKNLVYIIPQIVFFPTRGLFFFSPILILSLVGIVRMLKERRAEAVTILALLGIYVLGNALHRSWWGGGGFGLRYIMSLIPFLTLPLVYVVKRNRLLFFIVLLYSVAVNLSSTAETYYAQLPIQDRESGYAEYLRRAKTGVISNPVWRYYLPNLMKEGPRSAIVESFARENDAFSLRPNHFSVFGRSSNDAIFLFVLDGAGFVGIKTRYLPVFLLALLFSIVWFKELSLFLKRKLA
ncbi:MAG: glycosyltransferase family 39 protein [Elusimicrobia bacterium]|nr:glycosyltransferase family 39 protein [Elusimicrobiota bacterium]